MQVTLLIATVAAALTNWWARWHDNRPVETWAKPLTTMAVIALAIANDAEIRYSGIAVVALVLCLEGDIALLPAVDKFIAGLASFLFGHVMFIVLFARYQLPNRTLGAVALGGTVALAATAGRMIVRGAARQDRALRLPVAVYLAVISAMTVFGWATGRGWVIAGTTLFVVSDTLLGWGRFVAAGDDARDGAEKWRSTAVMVTYHGAIAALALSLW
ncbi:MAG: lysoplasmalogenase [Actinobacteria bacterium]|nr:lysoplasmalogenase [Actinomycetota bacterium]